MRAPPFATGDYSKLVKCQGVCVEVERQTCPLSRPIARLEQVQRAVAGNFQGPGHAADCRGTAR